jgi:hypothetical protein
VTTPGADGGNKNRERCSDLHETRYQVGLVAGLVIEHGKTDLVTELSHGLNVPTSPQLFICEDSRYLSFLPRGR